MQMDVICEPAPEAADAVRRAWDAARPVLVLDPRRRRPSGSASWPAWRRTSR